MHPQRPTKDQLRAAVGRKVSDILVPGLDILFCGINPGLYSAAVGHHFARPGNRFWPALHAAGFTPRQLDPSEERELLNLRLGITNIVDRATRSADELTTDEMLRGGKRLMKKVRRFHPRFIAVMGMGAFKKAFHISSVKPGRQREFFDGTVVWVLPNPSGLNAYYQKSELVRQLRILHKELRS
jgi:double-stranded uracil-DNA glycosylase